MADEVEWPLLPPGGEDSDESNADSDAEDVPVVADEAVANDDGMGQGDGGDGREEGAKAAKHKPGKPVRVSYDLSLPTTHSYLGDDLGPRRIKWATGRTIYNFSIVNLPLLHLPGLILVLPGYLGDDLEELSGRTIYDDASLVNLPLLHLPGVVLVPGQTVPLTIFRPQSVSMVKGILDTDKTFGLVTSRYSDDEQTQSMANIGTTAEIFSIKDDTDERSGITTLKVIAKGRQRFEVVETHRQITGNLLGKVRILSETDVGEPLTHVCPRSLQKFTRCQCEDGEDERVKTAVDRRGQAYTSVRLSSHTAINKLSCAHSTWWPPWVYKMYDTHSLMKLIRRELFSWNDSLRPESIPTDPSNFSFWIAQNLPVDDSIRLQLLAVNCPVQRLRTEYSILKNCTVLCCQSCQLHIANKSDVFSLSMEGPMGAYVNPQGYVHDIITVNTARGIHLVGGASTENSWFPGYAWTIGQCRRCHTHMGWRFNAVSKKLSPTKFYGLCRASISPAILTKDSQTDYTLVM